MKLRLRIVPTNDMEHGVVYVAVGEKDVRMDEPPPLQAAVLEYETEIGWLPVEVTT